jgi:uncharacterized repeat protein (TIGR01451 family)
MRLHQRLLGLTLLVVLACLVPCSEVVRAQPGRLTQLPGTGEPPLAVPPEMPRADAVPVVPVPVAPVAPPVLPLAPPPVVLVPADPPTPVVCLRTRVAACASAGCELEYRLKVENTSPAPAHHVIVRNLLPLNAQFVRSSPEPHAVAPELEWRLGTLEGLSCKEIVLVLLPTGTGDIKTCARVQFEHGQCVCVRVANALAPPVPAMPRVEPRVEPPGEGVPPEKRPVTGKAKLALKIAGPAEQQPFSEPTKYKITLSNLGGSAALKALISATLPKELDYVSSSAGGRHVERVIAWYVGDLGPGESRTVELTVKASAAGRYCIKARADADPELRTEDEACTDFKAGKSAVLLKMEDTRDPIPVGGETSYVIVVKNQGEVPVTNIRIEALVPPELKAVRGQGPTDSRQEGNKLLFEPFASLPPGQSARWEVFVEAVREGDARFRISLTADQLKAGGPVREEESTTIFTDVPDVPAEPPQS